MGQIPPAKPGISLVGQLTPVKHLPSGALALSLPMYPSSPSTKRYAERERGEGDAVDLRYEETEVFNHPGLFARALVVR